MESSSILPPSPGTQETSTVPANRKIKKYVLEEMGSSELFSNSLLHFSETVYPSSISAYQSLSIIITDIQLKQQLVCEIPCHPHQD